MNAGMKALLIENLKSLKLSTMIGNLESHLRQAKQDMPGYDEFLLNLTEVEVQVRKENGRKRRLGEAKFPLQKPLETFDFEAATGLDARLIIAAKYGVYDDIVLWAKAEPAKPILPPGLGWRPANMALGHALSPVAALPMN